MLGSILQGKNLAKKLPKFRLKKCAIDKNCQRNNKDVRFDSMCFKCFTQNLEKRAPVPFRRRFAGAYAGFQCSCRFFVFFSSSSCFVLFSLLLLFLVLAFSLALALDILGKHKRRGCGKQDAARKHRGLPNSSRHATAARCCSTAACPG